MQRKKGISLIVLVITIIVMIILATTIIISLNNSGIINKSNEATFKQNAKNYQSELGLYLADEISENTKYDYKTLNADNTTIPSIADVIKSIKDADKTEFIIQNGELVYIGIDENKIAWAEQLGIKIATRELNKDEYENKYEAETDIARLYGEIVNGEYHFKNEWLPMHGGSCIPDDITTLVVPYGATSLGLIYGNKLTNIVLPETVTAIAGGAFEYMDVTNINIHNKITYLGNRILQKINVESLVLPNSIEYIGDYGGGKLKNVNIPTSIKHIGYEAFAGRNIIFNGWDNLTYVEDDAFSSASGFNGPVILPDSVTYIGYRAFSKSDITSINIPTGITIINGNTFDSCTQLQSIIISKSVKSIGYNAFYGCTSLTNVYYEGTEQDWEAITIGQGNEPLTNANITYNYVG